MTDSDVNAILVRLAAFEARVDAKLDNLTTENVRGEGVHTEHDKRLTVLERALWLIGGAALASGGGVVALATKVLGS